MDQKIPSPVEQVRMMRQNLKFCPIAVDETVATLNRMELLYNNCDSKIEKYFAKEAINVLCELTMQMMTLASHPNLEKIVDNVPNGL